MILNIIIIFIHAKKINKYYTLRKKFLKTKKRYYNEAKLKLITFGDKLNWLAIHDVNRLKGNCSDKILLHEYSKQKIGKDICNKIIKIYDNSEQINIDELPDKFVLKTNHGSGFNIIVNNKTNLDLMKLKIN
jgi:hypothetical protein